MKPGNRWPRGPAGHPMLGSLPEFRRDVLGWLDRCAAEYGDFVPARLVFRRGFLVSDPEAITDVLVRRHHDFRKVHFLRNNRLFLGQGLLTSEGADWRRKRRWVQPAFHADRLGNYAQIITDECERFALRWQHGQTADMQDEMALLALTTLVRCLFAGDGELTENDGELVARNIEVLQERLKERNAALVPLPDTAWTPGNVRLRRAIRALDGIIYRLIAARRASGAPGSDLLSTLLAARDENGSGLTDRELRDEVMTMLFAGHDTTALTLSWTWYLLSQHPAAAARLRASLAATLGGRPPTAADVPKLGAVEQVIKESQRLYPPVYAYGRDAVRPTVVGGYQIPAGSSVVIAPWVLHRQARFFSDPLEFRPERWTPAFERSLPRFAYCPFGGGARQCLGKGFAMFEAVLMLATLAQRYQPQLCPGHVVELWPAFTLRSRHGMPMVLRPLDAPVAS